ncbi:hypothetical protein AB1484_17595 [Parafrankia sp. FMc6]|uniref:hypothetical protein n=1 Tax=Parafrankia soli TaxID=2599596 RepID=UPI0034D6A95A
MTEVVADGRTAHHGLFSRDSSTDQEIIREVLDKTGTHPHEELRAGPLRDVVDEIARTKWELRERHGGIMDTYLVCRETI